MASSDTPLSVSSTDRSTLLYFSYIGPVNRRRAAISLTVSLARFASYIYIYIYIYIYRKLSKLRGYSLEMMRCKSSQQRARFQIKSKSGRLWDAIIVVISRAFSFFLNHKHFIKKKSFSGEVKRSANHYSGRHGRLPPQTFYILVLY